LIQELNGLRNLAEQKHQIVIEEKGRGLKDIQKDLRLAKEELAKTSNQFKPFSAEVQAAGAKVTALSRELRTTTSLIKSFGVTGKMSGLQLLEMGENLTVVVAGLKGMLKPFTDFIGHSITAGAELQVLKANFKGTADELEMFRISSAGTVTDANLIKLSNQASDLGLTLKEQTIMFSLAENAADKYGGTVDENFRGLINSTEGATKVLKTLGIQKKVYEEAIKSLLPVGVKELDQLDAEAQKQIRIQALLKVSGESYDSATNKIKDNKDKLEAAGVALENFSAKLGDSLVDFFANQLEDANKTLNNFGVSSKEAASFLGKFSDKALAHIDILIKMVIPLTNLIGIFKGVSEKLKEISIAANDSNTYLGGILKTLNSAVPTPLLEGIRQAVEFAKEEVRALLFYLGLLSSQGAIKDSDAKQGTKELPISPVKNKGGKTPIDRHKEEIEVLKNLGKAIDEVITKEIVLATGAFRTGLAGRGITGKNISEGGRVNPRAGGVDWDELLGKMGDSFGTMLTATQSMLEKFGLMDTGFGKMLSNVVQALSITESIVAVIKAMQTLNSILGLIPGGGAVSTLAGGALGGMKAPPMGNGGGGMAMNPTFVFKGTLAGQTFLLENLPRAQSRLKERNYAN
jgi:hypothetical protein